MLRIRIHTRAKIVMRIRIKGGGGVKKKIFFSRFFHVQIVLKNFEIKVELTIFYQVFFFEWGGSQGPKNRFLAVPGHFESICWPGSGFGEYKKEIIFWGSFFYVPTFQFS